jgi:hypothetical protein
MVSEYLELNRYIRIPRHIYIPLKRTNMWNIEPKEANNHHYAENQDSMQLALHSA